MKVYVWGTGRLVGKVIDRYFSLGNVEAFIDNDKQKRTYMGKLVISPEQLATLEYDAVLVANLYSKEIYQQCLQLNINIKKVIFLYENCNMEDMNVDYTFVESVIGKEFADIIKNRHHIIRGVEAYNLPKWTEEKGYWDNDYVRIKSFQLVTKEIEKRNVLGSVAEVGVFRGEFAQYINYAFPERKCYLFDTFEGFDANEALIEMKKGNCTDSFVEAYKQTDIGMVLKRMTNLNNVIIKQGYFPESLKGLEEDFAFVSIDVDFEESIYECLKYFYPRLSKGGYIFVHDYNSSLLGVEKAVDRYENDINQTLCKMPLCDANGTLVIMKG